MTKVAADEKQPYEDLFAVWEEEEVTIKYAVASDSTGMGTVSLAYETVKAATGTAAGSTATAGSETYAFDYWTVDDGTESISTYAHFTPSKNNGLYEAHTYYAHFKLNKANVTVHHYLLGTETKVAEDVTSQETIGTQYTATPVTTYQEKNLTVDSYDPSQKVTVSAGGNVITIYYTLPLTIEATTASKTYDGTPLNGEYTVTGALVSDAAAIETALGTAPSITNVSESPKNYLTETDQADIIGIPSYYAVSYTPGTLTIRPATLTLEAIGYNDDYDGNSHSASASVTGVEGVTIEYSLNNDTWRADAPSIQDVGEKTVYVRATKDNYSVATAQCTLKVTPKTVTVSVEDKTVEYNGSEQYGNTEYTFSNVVSGQTATITYTAAKGTLASETPYDNGAYTENTFKVVDGTGTDVTSNYTLGTQTKGKLTITNRTEKYKITVKANSTTETYDGTEKSATGFETLEFTVDGNTYTVSGLETSDPSSTNVTSADGIANAISGTAVVKDANNNDVTAQFTVSTTNGTLKVTPREVTVSVKDKTVEYNGSEQYGNTKYTFSNVVSGQTATITYTAAKGTLASETPYDNGAYTENTFKVVDGTGTDVTSNYTLGTQTKGKLTITNRTEKYKITVKANSTTETYDGTEKSATGFETLEFTVDGNTYTVSGLETSDPSSTNVTSADGIANAISGTAVVKDANNNDVTAQFTVSTTNGTLKVTPKTVTVKVANADSVVYDGQPHISDKPVVFEGIISGETATITYTPAQGTLAGTYTGTYADDFAVEKADGSDSTGNYTLTTKTPGNLVITGISDKVTVTIVGEHNTAVYDGSSHSVVGYTATADNDLYDVEKDFSFTAPPAAAAARTNVVEGTDTSGITYMGLTPDQFTNINVSFTNVTFVVTDGYQKITPAALTITAKEKIYDYTGSPQGPAGTYTEGFDSYVTVEGLQGQDALTSITLSGSQTNAATYTDEIVPSAAAVGDATGNYSITYVKGDLIINRATATVTADDKSKKYGDDDPPLTAQVTGLKDGDADSVINYTLTRAEGEDVGPYTITPSGNTVQGNYVVVFKTGTLTINKAPAAELGLVAEGYDGVYDGDTHEASASTTVTEGTTIEYSTGENWSTNAPSIKDVGELAVQVRATNPNYETATDSVTLKVDPKTVTITADDKRKEYDNNPATDPELTATVIGVLEGETVDYSLSRDEGQDVDEYPIHVTLITKRSTLVGNYDVTTQDGTFTIYAADISNADKFTVSDVEDVLYNGSEQKQSVTITDANGNELADTDYEVTYSGDTTNAGTVTVTVTGIGNYTGEVTKTYNINPRKVVLTSESARKKYDGKELTKPEVTISGDGFVQGEVSDVKAIGTITKPGTVTNTIEYTPTEGKFDENNYDITLVEGKLSVYKPSGGGGDKTPALNTEDHIAYVIGYDDETVRPENNITRAEVAMIFFRLLTDETRNAALTDVNDYSDVEAGDWYNTAVSTMSALGIIKGYPDGTFKPNNFITRAEFAAIAARFDDHVSTGAVTFNDIEGHWAEEEVCRAAELGWVNGYPDGSFRPDQYITRAEAMALINRVLIRNPETVDDLLEDMPVWKDNMDTNKWYYIDVQEASIGHEYARKTNGTEYWTGLK